MIFLDTPKSCQTGRIDDFENAGVPTLPRNEIVVPLLGVIQ